MRKSAVGGRCVAFCVTMLFVFGTDTVVRSAVQSSEPAPIVGADPSVMIVTLSDDGRDVILKTGRSLIVRLEAIPGTGYGWQIVRNGEPQLQLEGAPRFEPRSNVEAGGVEDEVFRFRAQATGVAELECVYRRPWEKQGPGAKRFTIRIVIE
jgi:predicted secreted protein